MSSPTEAFVRWINAERDAHDANALLLYLIRSAEDLEEQKAQLACVTQLRKDANLALQKYLAEVQYTCAFVGSMRPTLH